MLFSLCQKCVINFYFLFGSMGGVVEVKQMNNSKLSMNFDIKLSYPFVVLIVLMANYKMR